jgi:hypothetical protein
MRRVVPSSSFAPLLAFSLCSMSLVACGGSDSPATPVTDSGGLGMDVAPDTAAAPPVVDTGVDAAPEVGVRPAACFVDAGAPIDAGAPTACIFAPLPSFDGGVDVGSAADSEAGSDAGSEAGTDAGDGDAGASDAGGAVYPAFALDAPRLINHGGPILAHPQVVAITWSDDADAPTIDAFVDKLGASDYWNSVSCEYGIGPAVSGPCNHVHIPGPAPATLTDFQLETLIRKNVFNWQTSGWPKQTPDTLYVAFVSDSTDYQMHVSSTQVVSICNSGTGGYHTAITGGAMDIPVAVVPRCNGMDETTFVASHELAEAALDPSPGNGAWRDFDDAHAVWNAFLVGQTENGDACEFYRDAMFSSAEVGYTLQRQWSSASFAAGHAPCVPSSATFFNATPLDLYDVAWAVPDFNSGSNVGPVTAKGVNIKVGETGSFTVGYYSDKPMAGDWTLKAVEGTGIRNSQTGSPSFANGKLSISVDKTTGHNGDKATVTVKVNGLDPTLHANMVTLVSSDPANKGASHYWPVLITSN